MVEKAACYAVLKNLSYMLKKNVVKLAPLLLLSYFPALQYQQKVVGKRNPNTGNVNI